MSALIAVPVLAQANGAASFLPLLLIVAVFYFLLIRPQQKKAKQHQSLVQAVDVGDRVVTIGGLHGTVAGIDDETMRLEIAPGTVITMTRGAIGRRLVDADAATDPDDIEPSDAPSDSTDTPSP